MGLLVLFLALIGALSAAPPSAVLRIYSSDRTERWDRQLYPIISLCESTPNQADFFVLQHPPCHGPPADLHLFLISTAAVKQSDLQLVRLPATDLVREWTDGQWGWELTLPAGMALDDLDRTVLGIETDVLECSAGELEDLTELIYTGKARKCIDSVSCPILPVCTSPRLLESEKSYCEEHNLSMHYDSQHPENNCNLDDSVALTIVVILIIVLAP